MLAETFITPDAADMLTDSHMTVLASSTVAFTTVSPTWHTGTPNEPLRNPDP
jgi:hypothetical protein